MNDKHCPEAPQRLSNEKNVSLEDSERRKQSMTRKSNISKQTIALLELQYKDILEDRKDLDLEFEKKRQFYIEEIGRLCDKLETERSRCFQEDQKFETKLRQKKQEIEEEINRLPNDLIKPQSLVTEKAAGSQSEQKLDEVRQRFHNDLVRFCNQLKEASQELRSQKSLLDISELEEQIANQISTVNELELTKQEESKDSSQVHNNIDLNTTRDTNSDQSRHETSPPAQQNNGLTSESQQQEVPSNPRGQISNLSDSEFPYNNHQSTLYGSGPRFTESPAEHNHLTADAPTRYMSQLGSHLSFGGVHLSLGGGLSPRQRFFQQQCVYPPESDSGSSFR